MLARLHPDRAPDIRDENVDGSVRLMRRLHRPEIAFPCLEVRDKGDRLPPGCGNLGSDRLHKRRSIDQRDACALAGRIDCDLLADALGGPGYDHALASEAWCAAHLCASDGENFS